MDLPTLSALEGLPTFTPSAGSHTGLELLAAAASAPSATGDGPTVLQHKGDIGLNKPGPFNPAATLAPKVAKKILDLEFVEMAEVTIDAAPEPTAGRPFVPSRPPVTNISQWTERFAAMAALLSKRYPAKAPELFAYLATVVRAERNYEAGHWAAYDRQFRREALARKSLDWSMPDSRLYSEARQGKGHPQVLAVPHGRPPGSQLPTEPQPVMGRMVSWYAAMDITPSNAAEQLTPPSPFI